MINHPQTLDEYIEDRADLKAADQTSELRRELEVMRQNNRGMQNTIRRYQTRNAELREALDRADDGYESLVSELDDETEKNAQLKTAVNICNGLLEESRVREEELRRTISHLREELDQAEYDRAKLKTDLFLSHQREDDLRNLLTLERLRQFQISEPITSGKL